MRHVDEGTIHAWLDGEIADAADVTWIEDHLRECAECRARLDEERTTLEQADALLAGIAPVSERPRLDELIAKAEARRSQTTDPPSTSVSRPARGQRWLIPVGWAASVTLAVGIGWLVRDAADTRNAQSAATPAAVMAEGATAPAIDDLPVASVAPQSNVPREPSASRREAMQQPQSIEPVPSAASQEARARAIDATRPAPRALAPADANELAAADSAAAFRADAAPAPAPPEPVAPVVRAPARAAPAVAPPSVSTAPTVSASAAAPTPDAQTLARSSTTVPEQVQVRERQQAAPQAAAGVVGNVAAGAATPNTTARLALTAGEWRTVPRTEAAVRSGMPLYGVNGLEPVATAIRSDNRAVRTTYRLESGNFVELEQERTPLTGAPSLSLRSGERAVTTPSGTAAVSEASVGSRTWSETRGNVRVLLRTASDADLAALGNRLRVE